MLGLVLWYSFIISNLLHISSTYKEEKLVWSEEFNTLDDKIWNHMVTGWRGGNSEFQYYRNNRSNSFVRDGKLHIKATFTADEYGEDFLNNGTLNLWGQGCNINYDDLCIVKAGEEIINPIQSARIRTKDSFSFTYGRVEVRAQMPRGDWLWPAIWLLPVNNTWPISGEIDMVEVRGNTDLKEESGESVGVDTTASTIHYGISWDNLKYKSFETSLPGKDFSQDFHLYGLEWTKEYFRFTIDKKETGYLKIPKGGFWELGNYNQNPGGPSIWGSERNAPYDKKFFFVLNLAVGGNFFSDDMINKPHPKPWIRNSRTQMRDFWKFKDWWLPTWNIQSDDSILKVDYIRVYQ